MYSSPPADFIPISNQSLNQQHRGFPGCTTKEQLGTLSEKLNLQGAKPYNMMEPLTEMLLEPAAPQTRCTNRINKDNAHCAQGPVPASGTSKASPPRAVPYRLRASQQIELSPPQSPRGFLCWLPPCSWWEGQERAAGQVLEPLWRSGK